MEAKMSHWRLSRYLYFGRTSTRMIYIAYEKFELIFRGLFGTVCKFGWPTILVGVQSLQRTCNSSLWESFVLPGNAYITKKYRERRSSTWRWEAGKSRIWRLEEGQSPIFGSIRLWFDTKRKGVSLCTIFGRLFPNSSQFVHIVGSRLESVLGEFIWSCVAHQLSIAELALAERFIA